MPEGYQHETGRVGHLTSTQSALHLPKLAKPRKTLFSQMPALRLRPKIHSSFAGYISKPLQAGKHQNPVHGLSKLKLLLGFSSRQTPANAARAKSLLLLPLQAAPASLGFLQPLAPFGHFALSPPLSISSQALPRLRPVSSPPFLFGFLLGPSRTGT